ncbi:hypothetical protein TDB9533_02462 [Thalassocella blandensis]|nr:hypothetical protein TDB9533_02462 [Thalassocella blandensis]
MFATQVLSPELASSEIGRWPGDLLRSEYKNQMITARQLLNNIRLLLAAKLALFNFSASLVSVFLISTSLISTSFVNAEVIVNTYSEDGASFPNPERGFHNRYDLVPGGETNFSRSTDAGNTLVHSYIRLDQYRSSDIPQTVLQQLNAGLAAARDQGKKVILRASYNFGPYPESEPDASEYWISQHLSQLSPVFEANQDVIAYLEAGFIGAWGEWHTSTHGLDTDLSAKVRIANEMLRYVPETLHVALRYPSDVRALMSAGVNANRLGNHQDCFLASDPDDWGTWGRDPAYSIAQDKQFIGELGISSPVGGETCHVSSSRVNCATALTEMQLMHFSEINEDFDSGVIDVFKQQGCYDEIDQKLGYRFRLLSASFPDQIQAGANFPLTVQLTNDGFASPYNARPAFAVLDGTGGTYRFALNSRPEQWKSGQRVHIDQEFSLPADMPAGQYRLSLWLPDRAENLRHDARYSIRLANQNTWDAADGYNVLARDIEVTEAGVEPTPTPTPTPTSPPGGSTYIYEAEAPENMVIGEAFVAACDTCSGHRKVGYLGNGRGALQFSTVLVEESGIYPLTVYYISGTERSMQISVNGEAPTTFLFGSTGSWTALGSAELNIALRAGQNTLLLTNDGGWAPDIDRIAITASDGGDETGGGDDGDTTEPPPVTGLVLDDFDNPAQWPGVNDLGRWAGANGFRNHQGTIASGIVQNGALVLEYGNTGWFGSDIGQSIADKKYLVLTIKGAAGGEERDFHISLGGVDKSFAELSGEQLTTTYKTIRIDLEANAINRAAPGQLQMSFWWGGSSTVIIDEIRFE